MRTPTTDEDAEILDYSYTDAGNVKCYSHSGNSHKMKCELTLWLSNCAFGPIPQRNQNSCPHKIVYKNVIAAVFVTVKTWNQNTQ